MAHSRSAMSDSAAISLAVASAIRPSVAEQVEKLVLPENTLPDNTIKDAEKTKHLIIGNKALRTAVKQLAQGKRPHIGTKQIQKGQKQLAKIKEAALKKRLQRIAQGTTDDNGDIQQNLQSASS